jgi:hypothetical protein
VYLGFRHGVTETDFSPYDLTIGMVRYQCHITLYLYNNESIIFNCLAMSTSCLDIDTKLCN